MYGWALLFSPMVSGLLADPLRQYPFLVPSESTWYYALLQRFPFVLPNVVAAIVCLGSLILVHCLVPETLVRPPPTQPSPQSTKTTTTSSRSVTSLVCQWWKAVWGQSTQQDTGTNHSNKEEQDLLSPIVNPPQPTTKSSSSSSLAVSATQQPHTGNQSPNNNDDDDMPSLYGTLGTTDDHQRKSLTSTRIDTKDSYHTKTDPLRRGASASSSSETSLTNLQLPQDIVLLAAQTDIQTALRASVQAFHVEEGSLMSSIQYRQRLSAALVKRRTTLLAAAAQTQPQPTASHTESDTNGTRESTWNNNTTTPSTRNNEIAPPSTDRAPNSGDMAESNTETEATIASLWAMKATRRQLIVFW